MSKELKHSLILLFASTIWGMAFVAQSKGGEYLAPYTFNGIRFLIGALTLLPVILFREKKVTRQKTEDKKLLWKAGIICGIVLAIASNFQQLGLSFGTSAGKAGFLTTTYIIFVPLLNFILFREKIGIKIWIGVLITLVGLYLLCINEGFSLELSDLLIFGSAVSYGGQILAVDKFANGVDPIKLSAIQFLVCGLLSSVIMIFVETIPMGFANWLQAFNNIYAWIPLLYAAVLSSGVGFTLQVIGQKGLDPTIASLLMSLESVFAVLSGWFILKQVLSSREILGCILVFIAVVIAQLPSRLYSYERLKPRRDA